MLECDRRISIPIAKESTGFPRGLTRNCSLGGPLSYPSPVVFIDRWYSRFRNFDSVIAVDVIRVKPYVDSTIRIVSMVNRMVGCQLMHEMLKETVDLTAI